MRAYSSSLFRVNDKTVPYVTAAIETSDLFVDHETNGIHMYVPIFLSKISMHSLFYREFHEKYERVISNFAVPDTPPPKPSKPIILSPAWFSSLKDQKPFLPPFLQFRFPLNIVRFIEITLTQTHKFILPYT